MLTKENKDDLLFEMCGYEPNINPRNNDSIKAHEKYEKCIENTENIIKIIESYNQKIKEQE